MLSDHCTAYYITESSAAGAGDQVNGQAVGTSSVTTEAALPTAKNIVGPLEANPSDAAKALWTGTPVESGKENQS